ncbi:MAG: pyridoxamine 5'-phosphate oxidase [Candidatus Symbiobacter sp.]|nr:pyridoxamine 5'-phosphate oxidase [Candidatus Symbiobacter sp.]
MVGLFDTLLKTLSHPDDSVHNNYLSARGENRGENRGEARGETRGETRGDTPFHLFGDWLNDAHQSEINDANAMTLSTLGENGFPRSRLVLLKDFSPAGLVFYTNLTSAKGRELSKTPQAALGFHWKSLRRQVRIEGSVTLVADHEADEYFHSRPYLSQIGAWASDQSSPLPRREDLLARVGELQQRYPEGNSVVPRPPYWSGFRLAPVFFEFWHDRPYRLHERLVFNALPGPDGSAGWRMGMLYP